jgi:hypothetical protein
MKKIGLSLCALTQGIRSEIDLISFIVEPEDFMAVIFELEIVKARRIGTKEFKHLALGKHRSQVNDAGKSVLPDDLDDPEYNRLRNVHGNYVSHLSSPACATLQPQTMHSSTRTYVLLSMLAHD